MKRFSRESFRYTPFFCEENIWWLARALSDVGVPLGDQQVLLFSNTRQSIVAMQQQGAPAGRPLVWDYHVVLQATLDRSEYIFDFDSRLAFPVMAAEYLHQTFPMQAQMPPQFRTLVRRIPAADYLACFSSDRSHMIGQLPMSAFPDYPPIHPYGDRIAVSLTEYRDMLNDRIAGCPVHEIDLLLDD